MTDSITLLKVLNFMIPFYELGSIAPRLKSQYKGTVYCLPLSPQEVLVLIWLTLEGEKGE